MADQLTQRVFIGGELAPSLRSRADLEKYLSGLALCSNFLPVPQGGVYSRPGLRFIGELADSTRKGRLIPFEFNTQQTYILVMEHLRGRVIMNGGYVLDSLDDIYEFETPYWDTQLYRLSYVQDADVMTIAHPAFNPRTISRTAHDDWTVSTISYSSSVSAPTGLSAVTTGTGHAAENKTFSYKVSAVDAEGQESLPSAEDSITIGDLTSTGGVRLTWSAVTGADFYRVYKDQNDSGLFGWIGDSKGLSFKDFNIYPISSDAPLSEFLPFNNVDHRPAAVGYYQQRQVFANSNIQPQRVFLTQSGIYNSFRSSLPPRDDDAIFFTIKDRQVNEIRHIVSENSLLLLTSGGEWRVTEGQDEVLTPSTLGVKRISSWGTSWVRPVVTGDSVIFVQEKGRKLRDLGLNVNSGSYQGSDLSIMAEHLLQDHEIVDMSYSLEPWGVLWCIRDDGVLLALTYQREHGIWAWSQHHTDGQFESVATIREGNRDATYFIVKREIPDGEGGFKTVRYVERLEVRDTTSAEDVFCVDSGLTYEGPPITTITGLDHLEGMLVTIVADGVVYPAEFPYRVTDGEVSIPYPASKITVGLPYTCAIETMDLDLAEARQSFKARDLSINKVSMEIHQSRGGWVSGKRDDGTFSEAMEIKPRYTSDEYDAIALKSYKQDVIIQPEWTQNGSFRVEQRAAMPLAILSVTVDVDIS